MTLAKFAYLGVSSTFMLLVVYNTALRWLPVGHIGLLMTMMPAFETAGASAYLGEYVGPMDLIGLVIVMVEVALPFSTDLFRCGR